MINRILKKFPLSVWLAFLVIAVIYIIALSILPDFTLFLTAIISLIAAFIRIVHYFEFERD